MRIEDEITLQPISGTTVKQGEQLLVYFVTGNPGLIAYYTDFLTAVQQALRTRDGADRDVIFFGSSLDGFEIHKKPDPDLNLPLGLPQQIDRVRRRLESKVEELAGGNPSEPMPVVLIGHSVGCYILMEVVAQWQKQRESSSLYWPVGGICLFPTVTEIAQSSKGRQLSWLLDLPYISNALQGLARIFHYIPRFPVLDWAIALNPGKLCVDVTAAMIKSQNGVRQLIYMANDEMKMIKEDQWLPELWGVTAHGQGAAEATLAHPQKTKLYFYWGFDDYWVDNQIRDALIKERGSRVDAEETRDWPQMRIADNHDIMHCFSLDPDHAQIVAAEVAAYLCELKARCSL